MCAELLLSYVIGPAPDSIMSSPLLPLSRVVFVDAIHIKIKKQICNLVASLAALFCAFFLRAGAKAPLSTAAVEKRSSRICNWNPEKDSRPKKALPQEVQPQALPAEAKKKLKNLQLQLEPTSCGELPRFLVELPVLPAAA